VWLKDLAWGNSWLCCSLELVALKRKDEAGEVQLAKGESEKGLGVPLVWDTLLRDFYRKRTNNNLDDQRKLKSVCPGEP
jgi:hypothetical protein